MDVRWIWRCSAGGAGVPAGAPEYWSLAASGANGSVCLPAQWRTYLSSEHGHRGPVSQVRKPVSGWARAGDFGTEAGEGASNDSGQEM